MANILRKPPDLNTLLSTVNVFVIRLGGNVLSALRVHVTSVLEIIQWLYQVAEI